MLLRTVIAGDGDDPAIKLLLLLLLLLLKMMTILQLSLLPSSVWRIYPICASVQQAIHEGSNGTTLRRFFFFSLFRFVSRLHIFSGTERQELCLSFSLPTRKIPNTITRAPTQTATASFVVWPYSIAFSAQPGRGEGGPGGP